MSEWRPGESPGIRELAVQIGLLALVAAPGPRFGRQKALQPEGRPTLLPDMAKRPDAILVDVHNLLHRQSDWSRHLREDAEAARLAFEAGLRRRQGLWLFYDGGPQGRAQELVRGGARVVYGGARVFYGVARSADDCIVAWLYRHQRIRAVVVTADAELRRRCRTLGAQHWSPASFWQRFHQHTDRSGNENDEADRGPPPAHEVADWLELFGDEEFH